MKFRKETEFQETEIGKIPREWKTVKLSSIAGIIMGQSPPSDTYNREGPGMPFLQGKMEFGRMYPSPTTYTTQPLKIAEPNDILISVRAPVGDVNIAPYKVCIGRGLAAIRFNLKTANHMFYFYYLQYIKNQLETLGKGSTFKAITKKDLEELLIPLPPIKEQEKVSGILTMIDKTIELYHEEREGLERLKRGLMSELLTGRIRVREENGRLSFYRETELQETKIGKIPKDWKVVKLGQVVEIWDKYRIPVKENERKPGPYPYCGANGIIDYIDGYTHDGEFVLLAEDGGFFGRFEKSAYVMRGKFWANNHVHVLKAIKGIIISEFLMHYLNFTDLTPFITGSTRPKLNQEAMKKIPIALPSIIEQMKIAEILSKVDDAIKNIDNAIAGLERLKRGLMDLLLTGKVRVVDGDVGS